MPSLQACSIGSTSFKIQPLPASVSRHLSKFVPTLALDAILSAGLLSLELEPSPLINAIPHFPPQLHLEDAFKVQADQVTIYDPIIPESFYMSTRKQLNTPLI